MASALIIANDAERRRQVRAREEAERHDLIAAVGCKAGYGLLWHDWRYDVSRVVGASADVDDALTMLDRALVRYLDGKMRSTRCTLDFYKTDLHRELMTTPMLYRLPESSARYAIRVIEDGVLKSVPHITCNGDPDAHAVTREAWRVLHRTKADLRQEYLRRGGKWPRCTSANAKRIFIMRKTLEL